jgi:hypothetical protein
MEWSNVWVSTNPLFTEEILQKLFKNRNIFFSPTTRVRPRSSQGPSLPVTSLGGPSLPMTSRGGGRTEAVRTAAAATTTTW